MKIKKFFEHTNFEEKSEKLKDCFIELEDDELFSSIGVMEFNNYHKEPPNQKIFKGTWWEITKSAISLVTNKFNQEMESLDNLVVWPVSDRTNICPKPEDPIYNIIEKIGNEIFIVLAVWRPGKSTLDSLSGNISPIVFRDFSEVYTCSERAEYLGFKRINNDSLDLKWTFLGHDKIWTLIYFIEESKLNEIVNGN